MALAILFGAGITTAGAQTLSSPVGDLPTNSRPNASLSLLSVPAVLPASTINLPAGSTANDTCLSLDAYGIKGWATPYPKVCDTILQDHGGFRSGLASLGIGVQAFSQNGMSYDLAQTEGSYNGHQAYNGEQYTVQSATQIFTLTYDLGRIGLTGGQIVANTDALLNSYQQRNGPNTVRLSGLFWYQPMLNKKVEFKVGYIINQLDFLGFFVAGSLASGTLGPQSVIPYQLGLSYSGFAAPTVSARIHWTKHFYTRTAIQRSLSPSGPIAENIANPTGANFTVQGAGVLQLTEVGYQRPSSPTSGSLWIRGGLIYNTTEYHDYQNGGKRPNWGGYALIDKQLTQPDPRRPFRGLYLGASVNYATPVTNLYTRYLEGRVYAIGPIAGRPFDLATFVATYNAYSSYALRVITPRGRSSYGETQTYIASYSYRVTPGLYAQPGLGVIVHPTYTPRFGTALNAYLSLVALF